MNNENHPHAPKSKKAKTADLRRPRDEDEYVRVNFSGSTASLAKVVRPMYKPSSGSKGSVEKAPGDAAKTFFHARNVGEADVSFQVIVFSNTPILHEGVVTSEAEMLFTMWAYFFLLFILFAHRTVNVLISYLKDVNPILGLLDPTLFTAKTTFKRSPFLFLVGRRGSSPSPPILTAVYLVVCTIASRRYTERPQLYAELKPLVALTARTTFGSGPETIETIAAYILLSQYPISKEENRTWIYLRHAIQVANIIDLHRPTDTDAKTRELVNRERLRLICFNLDCSTASFFGEVPAISLKDSTVTYCTSWCDKNKAYTQNFDIHTADCAEAFRVVDHFKREMDAGLLKASEVGFYSLVESLFCP